MNNYFNHRYQIIMYIDDKQIDFEWSNNKNDSIQLAEDWYNREKKLYTRNHKQIPYIYFIIYNVLNKKEFKVNFGFIKSVKLSYQTSKI